MLECLLAAAGPVVSAEELLERVWDEAADPFTTTVKTTIRRLRAKLGDPPVIHTVREGGYRIGMDDAGYPDRLTGRSADGARCCASARPALLRRVRGLAGAAAPRLQRPADRQCATWSQPVAYHPGAAAPLPLGGAPRGLSSPPGRSCSRWRHALAVLAGLVARRRFLRPLRTITATAQDISASNLRRRLSLDGPDDELTELGATLDDLFGRLEASFESQRHFVANASHELRTPLAGQRTLLQVALADPDADAQALRSACEEALQLSGQQEQLIDALLTLATSERGVESWQRFDLAELTRDIVHSRRPDAERHGVHIDASLDKAHAVGDPDLVQSLVANLLDNAIRHNIADGTVEVSTSPRPMALASRSATPDASSRPPKSNGCSSPSGGSASSASARATATGSASRSSSPSPPPTAPP